MKKIVIQKYSLISSDVFSAGMAYYCATLLCNYIRGDSFHQLNLHHLFLVKIADVLLLIILMWQRQIYFHRRPNWEEIRLTYRSLFTLCLVNLPILFLVRNQHSLLLMFIVFWVLLFLLIPLLRSLTKLVLYNLGLWQRQLYIIGLNENALNAFKLLSASRLLGYKIAAFVDLKKSVTEYRIGQQLIPVLNSKELFTKSASAEIVICLEERYLANHVKLINSLQQHFLTVTIMPHLDGLPLYGMEVNHFFGNEQLMLRLENNLSSRFNRLTKSLFDYCLTLLALPLVILVMLVLALLIYFEDKGNPFFIQSRVGKNGKNFACIKFRTMHKNAEQMLSTWQAENNSLYQEYVANNYKLKNDPRVTRIGRFLRKSSLDELPQLVNVLLGNMSLVGPRPLLPAEVGEYLDGLFYYAQVNPGLTGLWQISGRSQTSFYDRGRLDSWYIKNWSLWYDVVILIKTIEVVLKRNGAY